MTRMDEPAVSSDGADSYRLEQQIGFLLRKANQRHRTLFAAMIGHRLAPTQFAALAKLREHGTVSQNELGRLTATDSATIKGVIDRLIERGLVVTSAAPHDGRLLLLRLTDEGEELMTRLSDRARAVSAATLEPLVHAERVMLLHLLEKIC